MEIDRGDQNCTQTHTHTDTHTHIYTQTHTHTDTHTHTPAAHFMSFFFFKKETRLKRIYCDHDNVWEWVENPRNSASVVSSSFVRMPVSLKLCSTRTCTAITRSTNYLKWLFWINYYTSKNFRIRKSTLQVLIVCCVHLDYKANLFLYLKNLRIVIVICGESIVTRDLKHTAYHIR